jgi:hypothetical protein
LIELFQKFAEYEAEPHFNAKASAFATVLRNREAPLLGFGQSQSFPNVGKDCALSFFYSSPFTALLDFFVQEVDLFVNKEQWENIAYSGKNKEKCH